MFPDTNLTPAVVLSLVACQVYKRISANGLPFSIYAY